jgi:hypothetical protein
MSFSGPERDLPRESGRGASPGTGPGPRPDTPERSGSAARLSAALIIAGILLVGLMSIAASRSALNLYGQGPFIHHRWDPPAQQFPPARQFPPGFPGRQPGAPDLPVIMVAGMLGGVAAAGGGAAAVAYRRRRRSAAEWVATLSARFDAVREEYGGYQMDLLAVLDKPALADSSVPQTAAFITAYGAAQDTEHVARKTRSDQSIAAYETAVRDVESAWRIAREHAVRVGTAAIPAAERSKISRAADALHLALARGTSPAERRAAYRLAIRLIERVVTVPHMAIAAIEADQRPAITAADSSGEMTGGPR